MWSVESWDEIKFFFPDTSSESRIVVTTRQSDVANHFGYLCLALSFLDKEESWDLFCEKVFSEKGCPPELEKSGKKIVEKCGGLPLAIVVVASHLRMSSKMQAYWENVANHMNSILNSEEYEEQLFNILSLSYSHLPIHLKPCFLYMGIFSEDEKISLSTLIRLWIAEGFLKPNEDQSLEEVAEGCVNDLIVRNLIIPVDDWGLNGKSEMCEIHDVLRELCLKIAEKEKFFCVLDASQAIHRERRVVINERVGEEMQHTEIFHALRSAPLVRSVAFETGKLSFDLKLLRVVILDDEAFEEKGDGAIVEKAGGGFLEANFQKVNLRVLAVGLNDCEDRSLSLHSSISLLWNLQTLHIGGFSFSLIIAPYEIWEMTQLMHLETHEIFLPDPLPSVRLDQANDLVLQDLQTLSRVVNLRLSDEVCERIPNVKELQVTYSSWWMKCDEAWTHSAHNLGRIHKMEILDCSLGDGPEWRDFARSLTFPSSLKRLTLSALHLDWEEMTMMIGSLPLLEGLHMENVELEQSGTLLGGISSPQILVHC